MAPLILAKWMHVLSMAGVFGGLLLVQLGLPSSVRKDPVASRRMTRVLSVLLLVGLLAGAPCYGLLHGHRQGSHFNGVIGFKFAVLLLVGGLLPMSRKVGNGDAIRWISILLLATAALAAGVI